jgi:RNA polymerase sigma-70 factor (ECF subfamily)
MEPDVTAIPDTNDQPDLPDHELLHRFRKGQRDAATQLYMRYADRLCALAAAQCATDLKAKLDPEDIVQSVFRTFFRRAAAGQYEVPEGDDLWKLFLVIALNKIRATGAYFHATKRDSRHTVSGQEFEHLLAARPNQGDHVALTLLSVVIDEVLEKLPESQRQVIMLRLEGYEIDEIAEKTGRAKRSVERILQGFRQSLSRLLPDSELPR